MKKVTAYIKYICIWIIREIINLLNIFPVKNNRVLLYSFNGKKYSCNPKYISERLLDCNDVEIYWAFKEPENHQIDPRIKKIRFRSIYYYYIAKTSKVVIFNVQGYGELAKRKNQIFIQTWHASNGYKKVGNFEGIERKLNLLGHIDYSHVLSGSESMSNRRIRGSMGFAGPIIPGTPRMDIMINSHEKYVSQVYKDLNIPITNKLVLYAPTWRKSRSGQDYCLDYKLLKKALISRFGGEWTIAVRFHPNVKNRTGVDNPNIIDCTDYPEMQELLCAAQVLISDYSSCIWDYSFTYRPCFLFCYDLEDYSAKNKFDLPIETWGFPICENNEQLMKAIEEYDEEAFRTAMQKHHKDMGSLEDGHATERVCDLIIDTIKKG